jgi:hypothetical protein
MKTFLISALTCFPSFNSPTEDMGHRAAIVAANSQQEAIGIFVLDAFKSSPCAITDVNASELGDDGVPGFKRVVEEVMKPIPLEDAHGELPAESHS